MIPAHPERLVHWQQRLSQRPLPALAASREALAQVRARGEQADANALADIVLADPLLALRLLATVTGRLGERLSRPVDSVTAALVLLGIEPFFDAFDDLPLIEDRLAGRPEALAGARGAIAQAHLAARLAAAFAVHRQDMEAQALHQAALLSHFAGLLLWVEAPDEALAIAALMRQEPSMRSADAQVAVLGVPLAAVEEALMAQWGLPPGLREMTRPGLTAQPGPVGVALAVRIARHAHQGWDNPALVADHAQLAALLHLTVPAVQALVREVAGE